MGLMQILLLTWATSERFELGTCLIQSLDKFDTRPIWPANFFQVIESAR